MESCKVLNLGFRQLNLKGIPSLWVPLIEIKPIKGSSLKALKYINKCNYVVFTSPRGPQILLKDAEINGVKEELKRSLLGKRAVAVGPETKSSVKRVFGIKEVLVPSSYTTLSLGSLLSKLNDVECALFLRSLKGTKEVYEILRLRGIRFVEVAIYDEIVKTDSLIRVRDLIPEFNVIVVTSSLIAKALCKIAHEEELRGYKVFAIGPKTYASLRDCSGFRQSKIVVPQEFTYNAIKDMILRTCKDEMPAQDGAAAGI